jgi:hypothetical protein
MTAENKARRTSFRWLPSVALAATLVACGGGGGSGSEGGSAASASFSYTGPTAAAAVSGTNATALAGAAMKSTVAGAGVTDTLGAVQISELALARDANHTTSRVVERIVTQKLTGAGGGSLLTGIGTANEVIAGPCGGSATVTIGSASATSISGTVTFNNFCEPDVVFVSGTVAFTADVTLVGNPATAIMINALSITTSDSDKLSVYVRDAGTVFWVQGLSITIAALPTYHDVTVAGVFYHPSYGSVTVSTPTTLRIFVTDRYPASGSLLLTDAQSRRALITALDATTYQLQIDADANGSYETTTTGLWSEL